MSLFKKKNTVIIPFPGKELIDNSASFKGEGKQAPSISPEPTTEEPKTDEVAVDEAIKKMQYAAARASEISKALCMPFAQSEFGICQTKLKEFLMWAMEGHERNKLRAKFAVEEEKKKAKEKI